jgi:hypothetical protein
LEQDRIGLFGANCEELDCLILGGKLFGTGQYNFEGAKLCGTGLYRFGLGGIVWNCTV